MLKGLCLWLCVSVLGVGEPKPVQLHAQVWMNRESILIPDDRTYILFFFSTVDKDKSLSSWVSRLNHLNRQDDIAVIGLSAEVEERVSKFVKRYGVRFAVGAHSHAYKEFKVKRFPKLIVLDVDDRLQRVSSSPMTIDELDQWSDDYTFSEVQTSRTFDETSTRELLIQHATFDSDMGEKKRAVYLLRNKITSPAAFMSTCDDLLKHEHSVAMRGFLAYQKHLVDPSVLQKEPETSPSWYASRAMRDDPDERTWQRATNYVTQIESRSLHQLSEDYLDHMTDDPSDLVIRKTIAESLEHRVTDDESKREIRSLLFEWLPLETDFVIHQRLVGGFLDACQPGDEEAADFLEKQLESEENIRLVRPLMNYIVRYLRTGEE